MAGQGIADRCTSAVDHVEHAGGEACLVDEFCKKLGRQWRDFARLQHHRATDNQRWTYFGGQLVDWPVPRRDQHADTDWFMDQRTVAADPAGPRQFARGLDRFLQVPRPAFGLSVVRQVIRCAHFSRYCDDHFIITPLEYRDQFFDKRNPVIKRQCRIAFERHARCTNCSIDIVGPAQRDPRGNFFGRRVDRVDHAGCCLRQHPRAVDIGFKRFHLRYIPPRVFDPR